MQSSSGRIAVVMEAGKLRATKSGGHAAAAWHCPSWDRTRTLLIQSQACCQLHQGALKTPSVRRQVASSSKRRVLSWEHLASCTVFSGAEGARTPGLLG